MIENNLLPFIEINPSSPPVGSVIWLHGLGADGNDFVPIVSALNLSDRIPLRFVFPHAPERAVTINNGYIMRAWYDIISLASIEQHADQKSIDESVQQLHQLIQHEQALGIPSERIIVAGFSQGAVIALTTGLTFPQKLGGILALSGYLLQPKKIITSVSPEKKSLPIFIGHGKDDFVVPYLLGESLSQALIQQGFSVTWRSYPIPHTVNEDEIMDIANWLENIFAEKN